MSRTDWTSGQRTELARVILERWWQAPTPPIDRHTLGNDLNICKRLVASEGEHPDRLAEILELYDGPPATLRLFYATGNRNLLNELRGKYHRKREAETKAKLPPSVGNVLRGMLGNDAA